MDDEIIELTQIVDIVPVATTAPKYTKVSKVEHLISILGLSQREASQVLGISQQAVGALIKRNSIPTKTELEDFKKNKADVLALRSMQINKAMSDQDIKSMSPYQLTGMDAITSDQEREARLTSPDSVDPNTIATDIDAINARIAELQAIMDTP